jgi:hypothetical protein
MVLLISYDLNGHERPSSYAAVREMIQARSASWARPLYSQWFVDTQESVEVWHQRMKDVTDDNDRWFICVVQNPKQGWLSPKVWAWLDERV